MTLRERNVQKKMLTLVGRLFFRVHVRTSVSFYVFVMCVFLWEFKVVSCLYEGGKFKKRNRVAP